MESMESLDDIFCLLKKYFSNLFFLHTPTPTYTMNTRGKNTRKWGQKQITTVNYMLSLLDRNALSLVYEYLLESFGISEYIQHLFSLGAHRFTSRKPALNLRTCYRDFLATQLPTFLLYQRYGDWVPQLDPIRKIMDELHVGMGELMSGHEEIRINWMVFVEELPQLHQLLVDKQEKYLDNPVTTLLSLFFSSKHPKNQHPSQKYDKQESDILSLKSKIMSFFEDNFHWVFVSSLWCLICEIIIIWSVKVYSRLPHSTKDPASDRENETTLPTRSRYAPVAHECSFCKEFQRGGWYAVGLKNFRQSCINTV
jgi:hypothetical protein